MTIVDWMRFDSIRLARTGRRDGVTPQPRQLWILPRKLKLANAGFDHLDRIQHKTQNNKKQPTLTLDPTESTDRHSLFKPPTDHQRKMRVLLSVTALLALAATLAASAHTPTPTTQCLLAKRGGGFFSKLEDKITSVTKSGTDVRTWGWLLAGRTESE